MSETRTLTPRQRYWCEHLQACTARGMSLAGYAAAEGLSLGALYEAKSRLRQRGLWPVSEARFVRVQGTPRQASSPATTTLCRVSLPNGVVVETAGSELATVLLAAAQLR